MAWCWDTEFEPMMKPMMQLIAVKTVQLEDPEFKPSVEEIMDYG